MYLTQPPVRKGGGGGPLKIAHADSDNCPLNAASLHTVGSKPLINLATWQQQTLSQDVPKPVLWRNVQDFSKEPTFHV